MGFSVDFSTKLGTLVPVVVCSLGLWSVASPAEEGTQPSYQFNTDSGPKANTSGEALKFKAPGEEKITDAPWVHPVDTYQDDKTFKTYVGYPKHQLNVHYNPTTYGGTFSYQGTKFNFSSSDVSSLNLIYRLVATPEFFVDAEANYFSVKTKSGSAGNYTIQEGSVSVLQLDFRANYCWIGGNFYSRLCPGFEFVSDKYPLLGFATNSTLSMQTASDLMLGLNLHGQTPLIRSTVLRGRLGYLNGTGAGQSGALTSKSNRVLYLDTGIDWPYREGRLIDIGLRYEQRTASIEGQVSTNNYDKWDTSVGQMSLHFGYTWEFGEN